MNIRKCAGSSHLEIHLKWGLMDGTRVSCQPEASMTGKILFWLKEGSASVERIFELRAVLGTVTHID